MEPKFENMALDNRPSAMVKAKEILPAQKSTFLSSSEITTLVQAGFIPPGTPQGQIQFFSQVCGSMGLTPFSRQLYLIKRSTKQGDRWTVQIGIDGYRAIASRSKAYAGNDDYEYDDDDAEQPKWAKATVYRIVQGQRIAFSAKARWKEYAPYFNGTLSPMWVKMPFLMLGKVAEGLALRKAFPEVSGVYTNEEMEQGLADDVDPMVLVNESEQVEVVQPELDKGTNRTIEPVQNDIPVDVGVQYVTKEQADIIKGAGKQFGLGKPAMLEVLGQFGASKLSELKESDYQDVLDEIQKRSEKT